MLRTDSTGFGDIKVIQKKGCGYGVDAVLLAAFAAGETGASAAASVSRDDEGQKFIVAFVFSHKVPGSRVLGIEKREEAAARARESAALSGLQDRVSILTADVADIASGRFDAGTGLFDAVLSNPPYFRKDAAIPSSASDRYTARHETTAGIKEFAAAASVMLKRGGNFWLVHRPDRLVDIFAALRSADLEPKEMQLVCPHPGEPANIVLINAVKGGGPELRMLPELAVHTQDGGYTQEILRIYERLRN